MDIHDKRALNQSSKRFRLNRDIPIGNLPISRPSITIAWLENPRSMINRMYTFLDNDHYSVIFYSNIRKCIKSLKRTRSRDYVIIVLVSYSIDVIHQMIERLRRYRLVQSIYIVTSDGNIIEWFASTRNNIQVFENKSTMLDQLECFLNDIHKVNFEGGLFTTFNQKERALKDIRDQLGTFLWNDVLIMSVTNLSSDILDGKEEMLAECRSYYRNDPIQLSSIEQFEREYQSNAAIHWYTKPSFLFYLVNKALRSGDILASYTFRYFIKDLSYALKVNSIRSSDKSFRLYRGAQIHREEIEHLNVGCIVTVNTFFSCSHDRRVAEMFLSIDQSIESTFHHGKDERLQYVLFEIDVDLMNVPETIVANVRAQSELIDENEMIFTLGSTFLLEQIDYHAKKCIWIIRMRAFYDNSWKKYKYEEHIRFKLEHVSSTTWFFNALVSIKENYMDLLDYFHHLLRILPFDHIDRADVYYGLGRIYRFLEKYAKALICFRSGLLLLRRIFPEKAYSYCRILGGAGTIYAKLGDFSRAKRLLERAILLQSTHLPADNIEIPYHYNRLGIAYYEAKQMEKALPLLLKADDFFERRTPIENPGHVRTLQALGLVYYALNDVGKAYSYFKRALSKCESLIAKDHSSAASACYQISLIHEQRGRIQTALEYAKRALQIRLDKLPYYHSALKQANELVDRLEHQISYSH